MEAMWTHITPGIMGFICEQFTKGLRSSSMTFASLQHHQLKVLKDLSEGSR